MTRAVDDAGNLLTTSLPRLGRIGIAIAGLFVNSYFHD